MRIISQNRNVDIPYDEIILYINEWDDVYAVRARHVNVDWTLGTYPTKERAIEVMAEIREAHCEAEDCYHMPLDRETTDDTQSKQAIAQAGWHAGIYYVKGLAKETDEDDTEIAEYIYGLAEEQLADAGIKYEGHGRYLKITKE